MCRFIVAMFILIVIVGCSAADAVAARQSLRCNGALISVGDHVYKVHTKCGTPDLIFDRKYESLKYYYKQYGWTYTIIFRGSVVIAIRGSRG